MKGIQEAGNLKGKKVLVRIDIDDAETNRFPVKVLIPTLSYLKDSGAQTILLGHVGRDVDASAVKLFEILKSEVPLRFIPDLIGKVAHEGINSMSDGDMVLLENVRRDAREVKNNEGFAQELSRLADVYVNDAFAVSHREHSSVVGVTKYLPSFAGFGLQSEVEALSQALTPESPSIVILSGAKIRTKLPLIEKFVTVYDHVFVGGIPANSFLKARGFEVGVSVISDGDIDISLVLNNEKILIPSDVVVIKDGESCVKKVEDVSPGEKIIDAGPETVEMLKEKISHMRSVLWNGPLGEYEHGFDVATKELAKAIMESSAYTVVGGGDTVTSIADLHLENKCSFFSTGGGAMLQFLLDGTLPGIEALN